MDELDKTLDKFLDPKSEIQVLALKGDWGIGKTYFWEHFINDKIENNKLKFKAYSYISLFGKNTLEQLKSDIFYENIYLKKENIQEDEKSIDRLNNALKRIKNVSSKNKFFKWLPNTFRSISIKIPFIDGSDYVKQKIEYSLVNNYLICIDDIERKGNLSLKEILGLIDELRTKKQCKIILIFNEDTFDDNDKKDLKAYREKIIDHELKYSPTIADNLIIIFNQEYDNILEIEKILKILDCNNIRLFKNIKNCYDEFKNIEKNIPESNLTKFILPQITFLFWMEYICTEKSKYTFLKEKYKNGPFDLTLIGEEPREKSQDESWADEILNNLNLQYSPFDEHIDFYLKNGFFEYKKTYNAIVDNANAELIKNINFLIVSLQKKYYDDFNCNEHYFHTEIKKLLDTNIKNINILYLSSLFDLINQTGISINKIFYIEKYKEEHPQLKMSESDKAFFNMRIKNKDIRRLFQHYLNNKYKFNIYIAISNLEQNMADDWELKDLSTVSTDILIGWIKNEQNNVNRKISKGLLKYRSFKNKDSIPNILLYQKIEENTIAALKQIASESDFNRRRIKEFFDVEPDD
ncbi:P-loop NTPase fold protein [Celerinatantimonas sp. MCCC 1A17872]|uniref:P-loop NTPase fold protein n=1 Tax=Celerinatantimonas sp. MCCC 1A17872 TaxID=3177514 RepID=UPI0038C3B889